MPTKCMIRKVNLLKNRYYRMTKNLLLDCVGFFSQSSLLMHIRNTCATFLKKSKNILVPSHTCWFRNYEDVTHASVFWKRSQTLVAGTEGCELLKYSQTERSVDFRLRSDSSDISIHYLIRGLIESLTGHLSCLPAAR